MCTSETNPDRIQAMQTIAATIITGDFAYNKTMFFGIVESLYIQTSGDRDIIPVHINIQRYS